MKKILLSFVISFTSFLLISCSDYEYLSALDDVEKITFEPAEITKLDGTYITEKLALGSIYGFTFGENRQEGFFFYGYGDRDTNSLKLKRVFTDESKGMMVFLITKSSGYYETRKGQYLTLFVRNISSDAEECELAISTINGSHSIKNSEGDVIAKTLDEAKKLYPPGKKALFKNDMMVYAYLWMKLTRE